MGHKAYLLVFMSYSKKIQTTLPVVTGAGIYSSKDITTSHKSSYAVLWEMEGKDYQEAHDRLLEVVKSSPFFSWVWPWVDPSEEAHAKRYHLLRKVYEELGEVDIRR